MKRGQKLRWGSTSALRVDQTGAMPPGRMVHHQGVWLAAFLLLLSGAGCGGSQTPSRAGAVSDPTGEATVVVPDRWVQDNDHEGAIRLLSPERDAVVTIVEVVEARGSNDDQKDRDAAMAAWDFLGRYDKSPTEVTSVPQPVYDALRVFQYETDKLGAMSQALLFRIGQRRWVALVEGTPAGLNRRGAEVQIILSSLQLPGAKKASSLESQEASRPTKEAIEDFVVFLEDVRQQFGVPGMSVALVYEDKTVLARGFGEKELGSGDPIDADSLFMIGSTTKQMTGLLMAKAVDAGVLDWNDPIRQYDSEFELADVSREVLMWHSLCACTGLPRADLDIIFEFRSPEDCMAHLANLAPTTQLGETFQYNNQIVAKGGYVTAQRLSHSNGYNEAYETSMQDLIFEPLGMHRTTALFSRAVADANHALPHARTTRFEAKPMPLSTEKFVEQIAPAGAVWSSANDLAEYLKMEIAEGVMPNGDRLVSEDNYKRRFVSSVPISNTRFYALGYIIETDSYGTTVVSHGGATLGFNSGFSFLPEKKIGWAVLSNVSAGLVAKQAINEKILELFFDRPLQKDSEGNEFPTSEIQRQFLAKSIEKQLKLPLTTKTPDDDYAMAFLGTWDNDRLGRIEIRKETDSYLLDVGEWAVRLVQRKKEKSDASRVLLSDEHPVAGMDIHLSTDETTLNISFQQMSYDFVRQRKRDAN